MMLSALTDGDLADVALIWPSSAGLMEQDLRELGGRLSGDAVVWVLLDTESAGLRRRTLSRDQIVRKAQRTGFEGAGVKYVTPSCQALELVPRATQQPS
jgi:hypothetical protein